MKKIRLIALCLVLATALGMLSACTLLVSPEEGTGNGGGDRVDGSWDAVDFGGQTVRYCISVNEYEEASFPACDVYTRGPDTAGSNEVFKEVLARNALACETLGIKIDYTERDLTYDKILEDVRTLVTTSSKNSPDIYNNDINGLSWAMLDGLLWNVKNPGDGIKNYFDFEAKGWYTEYIKGCTFDQNKYYIFAGDYFLDMIRMAWVIYVNHDIFSANLGKMPGWCHSLNDFYTYVGDGFWDMDILADIASRVHVDSGVLGKTERTDTVVGLSIATLTDMVFPSASGVTLYYLDKEDGYRPCVMSDIDTYQKLSNKFAGLLETEGVYVFPRAIEATKDVTAHFTEGNVLFATQRLGEMEANVLRNFSAAKGLVPFPKWNQNEQDDYHTVVHNQAELGCILNTARAFSAASALMQYLNENSEKVVHAYYEKGLKYKYNSDKNARQMMDIVRDSTDDPFSLTIGRLCEELYTGPSKLSGMPINDNTIISSTFASEKDAYVDCMNKAIKKFASFP